MQDVRLLEEVLRHHREELRGVRRAVGVDRRPHPRFDVALERVVLVLADVRPAGAETAKLTCAVRLKQRELGSATNMWLAAQP